MPIVCEANRWRQGARTIKVAVIIPASWDSNDPSRFSVNVSLYIEAIVSTGNQPLLVCRDDSKYQVDYPIVAVPSLQFERAEFWRGLNLDIALAFTWMRHTPMLRALQEAGVFVIAKGDNDGMLSVRLFPQHHYQMMMSGATTPFAKARTLRHWMRRYLFLSAKTDAEVIDSIASSNRVSVETHSAKSHIERLLTHYNRQDLADKLCVLPHLVADAILTAPVTIARQEKIVAIGRWDDPQKDAPLLARAMAAYLERRPNTQIVLIGWGGGQVFASLCRRFPQVSCVGAVPREEIMRHLADARILLVTSRWESFHIAAHEALCLGATVVGPAVIPIPDICHEGAYGTLAQGRRPRQVADAMEQEMRYWEQERRNPEQIAAFWRPRLSADASVRQILQMAEQSPKYRPQVAQH